MQAMQMLQELRDKHGINPTQVAKRLDLTQSTVHRIATGETQDPRYSIVSKIKQLYDQAQKTPSSN